MASTPEGKVKGKIVQVLKAARAWYFMPVQTGMGKTGVPDVVACLPVTITEEMVGKTFGLMFAVEAKAPGREASVTVLQRKNLDAINEAGGVAFVASCAEEVKARMVQLMD